MFLTASVLKPYDTAALTVVHTSPCRLCVCLCKLPSTSPPPALPVNGSGSAAIPESLWPHISCWRDTDGRGPPSRRCHFVWVVLRCGFAAFGCWQGIKDFCWHGVALFQQGGKLTQGGVTGGKCVIECSLKTRQDEGIFGSSLLAHLFGFEQMCITSVLPSRSLHAFYSH